VAVRAIVVKGFSGRGVARIVRTLRLIIKKQQARGSTDSPGLRDEWK
jgi:hypothetical protein